MLPDRGSGPARLAIAGYAAITALPRWAAPPRPSKQPSLPARTTRTGIPGALTSFQSAPRQVVRRMRRMRYELDVSVMRPLQDDALAASYRTV